MRVTFIPTPKFCNVVWWRRRGFFVRGLVFFNKSSFYEEKWSVFLPTAPKKVPYVIPPRHFPQNPIPPEILRDISSSPPKSYNTGTPFPPPVLSLPIKSSGKVLWRHLVFANKWQNFHFECTANEIPEYRLSIWLFLRVPRPYTICFLFNILKRPE